MISASLVKELRDKTNAGMMDCKKALQETDGDLDAAVKLLREKGIAKAAKKADRAANEGIIAARIDTAGKSGIMVEVNCETDFVAKNENFQNFVNDLADALAGSTAATHEEALAVQMGGSSIADTVQSKVIEIGENLQARRFSRIAVDGEGVVGSYIHMGGKVGVLVEVGCEKPETAQADAFRDLVRDLTLHIAASSPKGVTRDDIDASVIEAEKDIFRVQLKNEGKPEQIIDKIIEGKIGKFYSENCLLEQGFVKDPDTAVEKLLGSIGKDLGDTITVRRFTRFALGEA
jgi:elongation factor Ts